MVPVSEIGVDRFFLSEGEVWRVKAYQDGFCEAVLVANVSGEYTPKLEMKIPNSWRVGRVKFVLV